MLHGDENGMIDLMAKKRGRPSKPEPNETVGVRLPLSLVAALDAQVARTRRTRTTEVQIALERYLAAEGVWSPPAKPKVRPARPADEGH